MKTLIVYATKYGTAEKAVKKLTEYLEGDIKIVNIGEAEEIDDIASYELIIIGGSIYAGKIQQEIKKFCESNISLFSSKKIGLFICCGRSDQVAEQLTASFGEKLLNQAVVRGYFGYEYNLEKMNFLFKTVVRVITGIKESKSEIIEKNIKKFADEINSIKEV
ncbi:MAG: flavodoxin [Firmicutes bacterium]|nr:flavodoxin [Bacillota bacterium]